MDDIDYQIAIFDKIHTPHGTDEAEVAALAQDQIAEAVKEAEIKPFGYCYVFSSSKGSALLDDLETLKEDLARLKDKTGTHEAEVQKHTDQINSHEEKILGLTRENDRLKMASEGYIKIRKRFLYVYVRDFLGTLKPTSPDIAQGNAAAHNGDAVTDASLYAEQLRTDVEVFRTLYGFS